MSNNNPKTIVFITGCFVGSNCWDNWQIYFRNKGYRTIADPWPFKDATPAELRSKHPIGNPGLAGLTLQELTRHYADIVKSLPEKPIVIGHSMGGLIAQILVNRDLAAAGVAIHPVAPQGVIPYEFSFYKAGWRALGLFTSLKKTFMMSFQNWQYAFVNGMPLEEQRNAYKTFTIPESKLVNRGTLTSAAKIDFKKSHAPLLITSGSTDNIIPAHLNMRNYKKYAVREDSVLEYKEFPGRNHFVLGQPTWHEDAAYISDWIDIQFDQSTNGIKKINMNQKILL
ncbi:MAG: alpha/beta hydrolase [Bacteroidetes bacterium]|nr:alpha/beta hydrolase [Bacteroidota bacterium]